MEQEITIGDEKYTIPPKSELPSGCIEEDMNLVLSVLEDFGCHGVVFFGGFEHVLLRDYCDCQVLEMEDEFSNTDDDEILDGVENSNNAENSGDNHDGGQVLDQDLYEERTPEMLANLFNQRLKQNVFTGCENLQQVLLKIKEIREQGTN